MCLHSYAWLEAWHAPGFAALQLALTARVWRQLAGSSIQLPTTTNPPAKNRLPALSKNNSAETAGCAQDTSLSFRLPLRKGSAARCATERASAASRPKMLLLAQEHGMALLQPAAARHLSYLDVETGRPVTDFTFKVVQCLQDPMIMRHWLCNVQVCMHISRPLALPSRCLAAKACLMRRLPNGSAYYHCLLLQVNGMELEVQDLVGEDAGTAQGTTFLGLSSSRSPPGALPPSVQPKEPDA